MGSLLSFSSHSPSGRDAPCIWTKLQNQESHQPPLPREHAKQWQRSGGHQVEPTNSRPTVEHAEMDPRQLPQQWTVCFYIFYWMHRNKWHADQLPLHYVISIWSIV